MARHIGRRKFLATLGGTAAAWPLAAHAQQAGLWRVGWLWSHRSAKCHCAAFNCEMTDWTQIPSFAAYVPGAPLSLGMPCLPPL
jgi:hypothetical protein